MERLREQKGYSLIELIVSMGIFAVIITIFTGFFVTLYRLQTSYRATADLNQEARIVSEVFSRYAREATSISYSDNNNGSEDIVSKRTVDFVLPKGPQSPDSLYVRFEFDMVRVNVCRKSSPSGSYTCNRLTSTNIAPRKFKVERESQITFPKVLIYRFQLNKLSGSEVGTSEGEKIYYKGYINTRNEL